MALWFASSHADTPWLPKALAVFVVAYALSPIDLIPDFIPVLGYLDELILLPGLIWLALRLIPGHVLADSRAKADDWFASSSAKPRSGFGAAIVIGVWTVVLIATGWWLLELVRNPG